jgi:arginine decarboxylase-like protein
VLVTVDERGATHIEGVLPGESCERVLEYMNYDKAGILDSIGKQLNRVAGRGLKKDEARAILKEFEAVFPKYTYLER